MTADLMSELGVGKEDLSRAGAEILDAELRLPPGEFLQLLVYGVQRVKHKNSPYPHPMETWHGMALGRAGSLMPRSVRGRSQLGQQLRAQVIDGGLVFVNLATGEVSNLPPHTGACTFHKRDGTRALLLAKIRIDDSKGKLAGNGTRIAYETLSAGVVYEVAQKRFPELQALDVRHALTLAEEDEAAAELPGPTHTAEDVVPVIDAPPAKTGKRGR